MKKLSSILFTGWLITYAVQSIAQAVTQVTIAVNPAVIVNFQDLADHELQHPVLVAERFVEQGEDVDEDFEFVSKAVPPTATHFDVTLPPTGRSASPAPTVVVNGVMSNATVFPPDIRGAVGPSHVMETTNQEFKVFTRTGTLVSTVSYLGMFSPAGATWCFDPHVLYDPTNGRWLVCSGGRNSSSQWLLYVAVSQTNSPTGNWYVYSFVTTGNTADILDYPLMGYNTNWVAITTNDFLNGGSSGVTGKIYVMNRANLYAGSLGTATAFTDNNVFSLAPAQTYDASQATLYMVQNWNGNSGGNGYVRISKITGTPNAPVYNTGSVVGVNQPWGSNAVDAPQLGSTYKLNTIDARVGNAVMRNGSLWFCQAAFLPASAPARSAVQWWQVNPATSTVQQFGRVDGGSPSGVFYSHPSIAVNANGDALLGHCQVSSSSYASASYSVRAATDAANTMQSAYLYKSGIATYVRLGGSRNRWGDYTGACVDPNDESFWNFSEWASTGNLWGTAVANVTVSNPNACAIPTSRVASPVGNSYATLSWGAVTGANSYRIQYRASGTTTWTTVTTMNTTYTATSLIQGTQYEWQAQAICTGGTSPFSTSLMFTTTGIAPCNVPSVFSSSVSFNSAYLTWGAVTGAVSYNIHYRVSGGSTWTNLTATTNSIVVTGLTAGTTYEWQVQTVCAYNTSAFSASYFFTTAVACNLPTSLSTTAITNTSATFNWLAVSGAVSYNVRYHPTSSPTWYYGSTTTNSYTATGLVSGTAYEWQAQTVCAGTASLTYTNSVPFTTTGTAPCYTPTSHSNSAVTSSSATLTWTAVAGAVSYNVRYRVTGTTTWTTINTTALSYTISGLTQTTSYEWQVQTVCSNGSSTFSSSAGFTTLSSCPNTNTWWVSNMTATTGTLNWSSVTGATSYNVRYRAVGSTAWITASAVGNYYPMSGLISGTNYEWQVQTVCSSGVSSYNSSRYFTTGFSTSCSLPSPSNAYSVTNTSASLPFTMGIGATSHNVRYRPVTSLTWINGTVMSGYNVSFVTGLLPATEYVWQVQSVCTNGASAFITGPNFMTTGSSCGVPGSLSITNLNYTTVTLNWGAVSGAIGYYYRGHVYGTTNWTYYYTTTTSNAITDLFPGTTYEWAVQTKCSAGTSSFSTTFLFTTLGTNPCGSVHPLTTQFITPTSAMLQWTAVSGALGYYKGYRQYGATNWIEDTCATNYFNLTGLTPNTDYEWFAQAGCVAGVSAYLPSALFTTAPLSSCSDNFESNNTSSTAFVATTGSSFPGYITPSTDVDWFRFTTSSPYTNLEIDLTNLPADYDLQLYASNATTLLGSSQVRGTGSEQIKYPSATASTYYVKVYGYNGANNASQCYRLQIAPSAVAFSPQMMPGDSRSITSVGDTISIESALRLFPNPAADELTVDFVSAFQDNAKLNVYNMSGELVISQEVSAVPGLNTQTVNTSLLSNGVYVFEFKANSETQRTRFTISR